MNAMCRIVRLFKDLTNISSCVQIIFFVQLRERIKYYFCILGLKKCKHLEFSLDHDNEPEEQRVFFLTRHNDRLLLMRAETNHYLRILSNQWRSSPIHY